MFLIQQANIRSSELKTAKEFNKEVANVNEAANKKISNIEVSAYASPDGGVSLNTTLAENRENNTTKMLNKDLKKAKSKLRSMQNILHRTGKVSKNWFLSLTFKTKS